MGIDHAFFVFFETGVRFASDGVIGEQALPAPAIVRVQVKTPDDVRRSGYFWLVPLMCRGRNVMIGRVSHH